MFFSPLRLLARCERVNTLRLRVVYVRQILQRRRRSPFMQERKGDHYRTYLQLTVLLERLWNLAWQINSSCDTAGDGRTSLFTASHSQDVLYLSSPKALSLEGRTCMFKGFDTSTCCRGPCIYTCSRSKPSDSSTTRLMKPCQSSETIPTSPPLSYWYSA